MTKKIPFEVKSITNLTLGKLLRKKRESLTLSLQEAAQKTGINLTYLLALESEDYSKLPPSVYTKGIIRRYSLFLGLNPKITLERYTQNIILPPTESRFSRSLIPFSRLKKMIHYRVLVFLFSGAVTVTILVYLFRVIFPIYASPAFSLYSPSSCPFESHEEKINLTGKIQPEAEIWIQQEKVFTDKDGLFSLELFLSQGENPVRFRIVNKFKRERIETCLIERK